MKQVCSVGMTATLPSAAATLPAVSHEGRVTLLVNMRYMAVATSGQLRTGTSTFVAAF